MTPPCTIRHSFCILSYFLAPKGEMYYILGKQSFLNNLPAPA